jgi:NADH-quinone oxidoreductase subunit K
MITEITTTHWIVLATVLFGIGLLGVLVRRNALVILLSVELMLNAANLVFVALGHHLGDVQGQVIAMVVMAIAAAEATVGLAVIVLVSRTCRTLNPDELTELKG